MVQAAGITNTNTQLLINAINPIFSMIAAIVGASMLDRLGRRTMMMYSLVGALACYILLTAFSAQSENTPNLAYGVIVSIYLFGICFAWGFTPLQTLYSVECLENRTRAKGSGLNFLFLNVAMVINTYGISEGIAKIGWKLCESFYQHPWYLIKGNGQLTSVVPCRHRVLWLDCHRNRPHLLLRCRNIRKDTGRTRQHFRGQESEKGEHTKDQDPGRSGWQYC